MKKSIISMAVAAGVMASGAAFAESTVYGHAQVEVGSWGSDTTGTTVEDNARGRIGFKSSEDLGDGMKALAKFEFKVDTADGDASDTGGISLQKREMLVGLKTGMGTVELGRLKSAYKYYGGVKYDPYVASLLEARGNGGMTGGAFGHNSFISDSVAYEHEMGAINFRLTYDLQDAADGGDPTGGGNGANAMTFGIAYSTDAFEVIVATVSDDATNEYSSTKFGGKVKLGGAGTIQAQLESSENDTADTDTFYVDYQFPIDKNNIIDVALGNTEETTSGVVTEDVDFTRVAFTHKLSKETKVWAGYRASDAGPGAETSVIALGMQKQF